MRDRLLERPSPDLDLTTDAVPAAVRRLARDVQPDAVHGVGEKFGTIGLGLRGPEHRDHDLSWRAVRTRLAQATGAVRRIARRGPGAARLHHQRHGARPANGRDCRPVWRADRPARRADSRRWRPPRAICRRPAAAAAGGAPGGPVGIWPPPRNAGGYPHPSPVAKDDQPRARGRRAEQDSGVAAPGIRHPPCRDPRSDAATSSRRC